MNETSNEFPDSKETNSQTENGNAPIGEPSTSLQPATPYLLHIQTGETMEVPENKATILLGKPNNTNPPDVDLSELPNAEIVSRQHAYIHLEADNYYIEDLGSSNGTYVNNASVGKGERMAIASGDIIALGKEDKVTFIFKLP